ncbi:transposase [Atopobium sp. oral taxon 416]|nr:transposase [Atopobium sp. oral taxon 416]
MRVGIDDTAKRRNQSYISIMANLDGQRAVAVTQGRDKGALGRLCAGLEEHGGDRAKIQEVTRDMAEAYSLGVAAEMPQATQSVDRFHVVQLLMRAIDPVRCQERRESASKRRQLAGTKYLWLKKKESLTKRQRRHAPARWERRCRTSTHAQTDNRRPGPQSASARGWRTLPWPR